MRKITFKQVGSGCALPSVSNYDPKRSCDVHYKADNGEEFRVYTSMTGNRYLPEEFTVMEMSEIKQAEQDAINEEIIKPNQE